MPHFASRRLPRAALAAALLLTACAEDPTGPSAPIDALPRALSESEQRLIVAGNSFAAED